VLWVNVEFLMVIFGFRRKWQQIFMPRISHFFSGKLFEMLFCLRFNNVENYFWK